MIRTGRIIHVLAAVAVPLCFFSFLQPAYGALIVQVLTKSGTILEGTVSPSNLVFATDTGTKKIAIRDLKSFHSGEPASVHEAERISADLKILVADNEKGPKFTDAACAELVDIGLPVISPLLAAYKDTDAHEPNPLYRVFARIVPGNADGPNRSLDLVRPVRGVAFRGKVNTTSLHVTVGGKVVDIPSADIRRIAIRQGTIERQFDLQALQHCSYVAYFDTGIAVTPDAKLRMDSTGYVRLSFDEDGWACDPDGIADPLPGKRRLQEGFRWGAILGRVGPTGTRWLAGKHVEKSGLGLGRLYVVVNDNEHWQNNIGSYRVRLRVTDAYDLGDPN